MTHLHLFGEPVQILQMMLGKILLLHLPIQSRDPGRACSMICFANEYGGIFVMLVKAKLSNSDREGFQAAFVHMESPSTQEWAHFGNLPPFWCRPSPSNAAPSPHTLSTLTFP